MGKRQQHFSRETLTGCLVFGLLVFVVGVSANAIGQKDQDAADSTPGLYNASDQVYILDNINFKSSVLQSKRAWLVEFYNSWCGFCYKFAPIWKALAKSVHGWRKIVTIAAIDCANDDNNPLCREYEVMRYPTLKFFPVNSKSDFLGLEVQKDKDEELIMQALVNQLEKEQQEQRAGLDWPNLAPYRNNDIETLWQGIPANIEYQFLIFEEPNAYLGAEVILDLYKLNTVRIRRATSENVLLTVASKVSKYPSILAINKDHTQTILKVDKLTREGLRETILEFLKLKGISADVKDDVKDDVPDHTIKQKPKKVHNKVPVNSDDKLYQLDLESTIRYSLNNEIPLSKNISGEKLKALQSYLKVLALYFPAYLPNMKTYLQVLSEFVNSKSNITGKDFRKEVKSKEEALTPIYSGPKNTWIGCKGSDPTLRGYPCGLWTLFHTLTVAVGEDIDEKQIDYDHPIILSAMHGYIKHFFGCANCAAHFQEMAKNRDLFGVHGNDVEIIWLWKAHNEVNERLAGDETEDPEHKKIQYPSFDHCPQCKGKYGKWDEHEVLSYLKTKYSKSNIHYEGISDQLLLHDRAISASRSGVSHRKIGWDFTIFDISICVVLYVASAAIIIMVCIKFAYKRTHKKKDVISQSFWSGVNNLKQQSTCIGSMC